MAEFPVFPTSEREPNTDHISGNFTVPANLLDDEIEFAFVGIDLVAEPSTTVFSWHIEKRPNASQPWTPFIGAGGIAGRDGVPAPHGWPVGKIKSSVNPILKGQQIRGVVSFTSVGDINKTWGVEATTL